MKALVIFLGLFLLTNQACLAEETKDYSFTLPTLEYNYNNWNYNNLLNLSQNKNYGNYGNYWIFSNFVFNPSVYLGINSAMKIFDSLAFLNNTLQPQVNGYMYQTLKLPLQPAYSFFSPQLNFNLTALTLSYQDYAQRLSNLSLDAKKLEKYSWKDNYNVYLKTELVPPNEVREYLSTSSEK